VLIKSVITTGPWRLFARFTDEAGRPLPDLRISATGKQYLPRIDRSRPLAAARASWARSCGSGRRPAGERRGRGLARLRPLPRLSREAADRDIKELERRWTRRSTPARARRRCGAGRGGHRGGRPPARAGAGGGREPGPGRAGRWPRRSWGCWCGPAGARALPSSCCTPRWLRPACLPAVLALAARSRGPGCRPARWPGWRRCPSPARLARGAAATGPRAGGAGTADRGGPRERRGVENPQSDVELGLEVARARACAATRARRWTCTPGWRSCGRTSASSPPSGPGCWKAAGICRRRARCWSRRWPGCPTSPPCTRSWGRLLVRAEDSSAGIEHLRQALALRPQNPVLRRYLARLSADAGGASGGEPAGDWARPWIEDGRAMASAALGGAPPKDRPRDGSGAVVLLDQQVVRVHPNGSAERFAQRVVQVQSEQAAREQMEFQVRYTPGTRRWRSGGRRSTGAAAAGEIEVLQATGRDDRDLSEPWYGLYYDCARTWWCSRASSPATCWRSSTRCPTCPPRTRCCGYFGDIDFVSETVAARRWRYVLLGPPAGASTSTGPRCRPGIQGRAARQEIQYTFAARDVARVVAEPGMPGWAEISPYLHISTYAGWEDVGRWYWRLVADQLAADQTLRRAARPHRRRAAPWTRCGPSTARPREAPATWRWSSASTATSPTRSRRCWRAVRRLQGQGLVAAGAAARGGDGQRAGAAADPPRRAGGASVPASLAVFDHAIVYVPRCRCTSTAPPSSRAGRAALRGSGRDRAAGGPAHRDPGGDAGASALEQPGRAPLAGGARRDAAPAGAGGDAR
jgi:hypothetical protein